MKHLTLSHTLTLAVAITLAACTTPQGGREDYAKDGDTGAAAPATVQTVNSPNAPDSTAGVGQRSGKAQMAGDTNTARNTGTIQGNQNTQSVPGAATGTAPKAP